MRRLRRQRASGGQAIVEMALLFPILIALVFNFIAIMLQVVAAAELQSAMSLAASSAIQADLGSSQGVVLAQEAFNATFKQGLTQAAPYIVSVSALKCTGDYLQGIETSNPSQPVSCTVTVVENFANARIPFIFWKPTLTVTAVAYPPPVRYCGGGAC
jgi:Flp pilus assembly protein TadG